MPKRGRGRTAATPQCTREFIHRVSAAKRGWVLWRTAAVSSRLGTRQSGSEGASPCHHICNHRPCPVRAHVACSFPQPERGTHADRRPFPFPFPFPQSPSNAHSRNSRNSRRARDDEWVGGRGRRPPRPRAYLPTHPCLRPSHPHPSRPVEARTHPRSLARCPLQSWPY
jgi:hypothetical protein